MINPDSNPMSEVTKGETQSGRPNRLTMVEAGEKDTDLEGFDYSGNGTPDEPIDPRGGSDAYTIGAIMRKLSLKRQQDIYFKFGPDTFKMNSNGKSEVFKLAHPDAAVRVKDAQKMADEYFSS